MFTFDHSEEVILEKGHISNTSAESFVFFLDSTKYSLISSYFKHFFGNIIKIYSTILKVEFRGNVFFEVNIHSMISRIPSLTSCFLEKNYFYNVTFSKYNYPFNMFKGDWAMKGNTWENTMLTSAVSCFFDVEICYTINSNNSFLFFDKFMIQSLFCFWHCFEITFEGGKFINFGDSFSNGVFNNEDTVIRSAINNCIFLLVKSKNIDKNPGIAIYSSGTPLFFLEDNLFINLKCKTAFDIRFAFGCIAVEGKPSFARLSNNFFFLWSK